MMDIVAKTVEDDFVDLGVGTIESGRNQVEYHTFSIYIEIINYIRRSLSYI